MQPCEPASKETGVNREIEDIDAPNGFVINGTIIYKFRLGRERNIFLS